MQCFSMSLPYHLPDGMLPHDGDHNLRDRQVGLQEHVLKIRATSVRLNPNPYTWSWGAGELP